jgi:multiple sugar transport system ATP-binding protein
LKEENGSLSAVGENFKLTIPKNFHNRYQKTKDQECILGIRPEDIYDRALKAEFPGGESLRGTVDVVEPVGSEVILLVSCGSTQFTACVDPQTQAKSHIEMEFLIDMNRMHLFNKLTGEVY